MDKPQQWDNETKAFADDQKLSREDRQMLRKLYEVGAIGERRWLVLLS
jgi:hypothetical protein